MKHENIFFVFNFLNSKLSLEDNHKAKIDHVKYCKKQNNNESIELFTDIEDLNFIRAVGNFVKIEKTQSPNSVQPEKTSQAKIPQSAFFGAGVGLGVGLVCVSALGLGIVSVPAVGVVASTTVIGATAFYLANHEMQK